MSDLLREHLFSDDLVRIVLSGPQPHDEEPWSRIVMRPVLLSGRRSLQIQRYDAKHCDTVNADSIAHPAVAAVLSSSFRHLTVQLADRRIQTRRTKRGKLLSVVTPETADAELSHDRKKKRLIPENADFLAVLGMTRKGQVRAEQQRKYRQINEFVRAVAESSGSEWIKAEPIRLVDFGCGNAYLTFATFHYLAVDRGLRCEMIGIDRDSDAIARNRARARELGLSGLRFEHASIPEARLPDTISIALALHACDTATDEAIARAVACRADLILVAPCCHHHIHRQLSRTSAPAGVQTAMRSDVLRARLGDVLTESFPDTPAGADDHHGGGLVHAVSPAVSSRRPDDPVEIYSCTAVTGVRGFLRSAGDDIYGGRCRTRGNCFSLDFIPFQALF
ncbi:class I SAM-dependent methyltransferase [Streptosporangium sp. KLBMP 9127]|nr:SAM-dependent methyltransferase [Streptosporangium sp. KLBMP 9127]